MAASINKMTSEVELILKKIQMLASEERKKVQAYFKIGDVNSFGLTQPQIKLLAKEIGKNHALALELWESGVHEARHIALLIADKNLVTEELAEKWIKDFNSWDIVDGCCSTLLCRTPFAFKKAIEWTKRKEEYEKRTGFALMAMLAVHDKKATNEKFEKFIPYLLKESHDDRNFVKKAINWAIRQIGKRNIILCKEMIELSKAIREKGDSASRWIAADALRELEKYKSEGKIKNHGEKVLA